MKIIKRNKGILRVTDGKLDITDPCYDHDVWYRLNNIEVMPGKYRCSYYICTGWDDEDYEEYVNDMNRYGYEVKPKSDAERLDTGRCFIAELQLDGHNYDINSDRYEKIGEIGVDAGMAGFFLNKPDFNNDEWSKFCNSMSLSDVAFFKPDFGFWTNSGYGDGCYDVFAVKDNGEIIALLIRF